MDEDRDETTRRLFHFALEIISLLSGEDYTIVRKTPGGGVTPIIHLQESGGRSPGPITEPPPHSLLHERNKKILELSNKMIELLSGRGDCWEIIQDWRILGNEWRGDCWDIIQDRRILGDERRGDCWDIIQDWRILGDDRRGDFWDILQDGTGGFWVMSGEDSTGGFWVMSGEVTAGTLFSTGGFWVMSGEVTAGTLYSTGGFWVMSGEDWRILGDERRGDSWDIIQHWRILGDERRGDCWDIVQHWRILGDERRGDCWDIIQEGTGGFWVMSGEGDMVSDPKKVKPNRKCAACAAKLPSTYKKKLCQPCTDEVLRSEQPSLMDSIRTLIRQEVQSSMAAFSQARHHNLPLLKKGRWVRLSQTPTQARYIPRVQSIAGKKRVLLLLLFPNLTDLEELISMVRGTMGVEEEAEDHSVQDDMFGGLKPKSIKGFPIHENIENLILQEWGLPEKGLNVPSEFQNCFPLEGDCSLFDMPKVDVQVSRVTKKTALPFEDSSQLKDPMDRKTESLLRKSWETLTNLLRSNVASTCVARSLFLWLRTLENRLVQGTSREDFLNSLSLLQKELDSSRTLPRNQFG
ncbi:unnamed protein product [Ranitomeya imitator]|uniref:Uncharacterized protein n=1 Tax=Ranitomeya imitator TaxID=111125 RepID=A0ABN9M2H8_9NEOB|nr:unnamed protein product [Ranitomeya imitator]